MEKIFRLKENGTKVSTEIIAGLTTFFAMSYIIVVNPGILAEAGMEWGAVFLATIISAIVGAAMYKEKLTFKSFLAVVVGIIALVGLKLFE